MNESTFLCLFYVYLIFNQNKYSNLELKDFKNDVFKLFKASNCIRNFYFNLLGSSLELSPKLYRLRRNFVKFLKTNNSLLGYDN